MFIDGLFFLGGGGKRWVLPDIHTFNIKKIIASGKKNCVKIHVRSTGDALKTCRVEICSTRVAPCHSPSKHAYETSRGFRQ